MAPLSPKHIANIERENTKTQSVCSHKKFPTPTHTTAHLTSCVGGATPPPHKLACISLLLSYLSPRWPHNCICLVNCKELTFDLLTRPPKHLMGVKGHTDRGHTHLLSRTVRVPQGQSTAPQCHAQPEAKKKPATMYPHKMHTGTGTRPQA